MISRENKDPYYDLIDDFGLIVSSFQSQYGLRLSREIKAMKWDEFRDLLAGLSPDTALGRVVAIRSEDDKDVLKRFTPDQRQIRREWQLKRAKELKPEQTEDVLKMLEKTFVMMAGGVGN